MDCHAVKRAKALLRLAMTGVGSDQNSKRQVEPQGRYRLLDMTGKPVSRLSATPPSRDCDIYERVDGESPVVYEFINTNNGSSLRTPEHSSIKS